MASRQGRKNSRRADCHGCAKTKSTLPVVARNVAALRSRRRLLTKEEWQRWNDYGIGLFLQGDLKAPRLRSRKSLKPIPKNPDGWVNIGRVAVQEGDMERARTVLEKALVLIARSCPSQLLLCSRAARRTATTTARPLVCSIVLSAVSARPRRAQRSGARALPAAKVSPTRSNNPASLFWPSIPKTCRRTTT